MTNNINDINNIYRTSLLVDLNTVRENYTNIKKYLSGMEVFAVIKADAYGTGAEEVAGALLKVNVDGFAVSCLAEAIPLLKYEKPIQILGAVFDFELPIAVEHDLILAIADEKTAERISREAVKQNKTVECYFKLDTGMGRFGMTPEEALQKIPEIIKYPNLSCCGIFSHLPAAGEGDESALNREQERKFLLVLSELEKRSITFKHIHFSNSPGMNSCEFVRKSPFTRARIGLCLHGLYDDGPRTVPLTPTMKLVSRLASVRWMKKGSTVGYSRTHTLEEDTLVGLVAAGYADGVPLALSNCGSMLFRGKKCKILGRISMDYTAISLQEFAGEQNIPETGEKVTLLGTDGKETVSVYDWAEIKKTHPYEILCALSPRVARVYLNK
ncbi:MAG: alanine racemase [Lentisphaeria bacterium]|nr:alanine racemase [Lentisphaeria bacterium]